MPKVGKKHFKYTKKGREKAKKHAKKTGLEIEYMGGGVVNRKYYAMGGRIRAMRKKRKERKEKMARKSGSVAAKRAALLGLAQFGLAGAGADRAGTTPAAMREYRKTMRGMETIERIKKYTAKEENKRRDRAQRQAAQDALRQAEIGLFLGASTDVPKKTTRKKVGPDWHKKGKK